MVAPLQFFTKQQPLSKKTSQNSRKRVTSEEEKEVRFQEEEREDIPIDSERYVQNELGRNQEPLATYLLVDRILEVNRKHDSLSVYRKQAEAKERHWEL
ncbi:hypothetical protein M501DRAFT_1004168 [Patellaria atrata CBS 101060]|uniref:Uncharacterized protein n=1 Tax=Patellaria atrata CBS 101060 TaxID=1346257 RepID=A0A9P4S993_9PEZI|nr:hypothetical protein M501DRAFT_1004168 [Patellaria atrata CBS 101060]